MDPANGPDATISRINGSAPLHVVMFPFLAFGHISPFVQLSNKLTSLGVAVTFLSTPANASRISASLRPPARIATVDLPRVDGLPPGAESTSDATPAVAELLKIAVDLTRPQVASLLENLRPDAVFFDFAQPWLPSVAHPLGIRTVFFSVFSAVSSAFLTVPARQPAPSDGIPEIVDRLRLPPQGFPTAPASCLQSVPPYQAEDFAYIFKSFVSGPPVYERVMAGMDGASAIAIKSCDRLEAPYIRYLASQYRKPVLLAGPVVPEPPSDPLDPRWGDWLDRFPDGGVVFCSFGSETFLPDDAIRELALGLEMTGMPFLLVLNFPKDGGEVAVAEKLPEGFEERVAGRGLVHRGWVQQQQILAHRSVGCFLCHAGFSSVAEGLVGGCRLVLLPRRGDQYLNARLFAGDLRAAVEVRREEADGGFRREAVAEAVAEAMGEAVGERGRKLREFFLDGELQAGFMVEFIAKIKDLVIYGNGI